jgi:hypothetical protein
MRQAEDVVNYRAGDSAAFVPGSQEIITSGDGTSLEKGFVAKPSLFRSTQGGDGLTKLGSASLFVLLTGLFDSDDEWYLAGRLLRQFQGRNRKRSLKRPDFVP